MNYLLIAGALSYLSIALVKKDGPNNYILKFRNWLKAILGSYSPLECIFCTSAWLLVPLLFVWILVPELVYFFGLLGIARAIQVLSGEY